MKLPVTAGQTVKGPDKPTHLSLTCIVDSLLSSLSF